MASPKIKVSIPRSLGVSSSKKTALKKAFHSDVVRILKIKSGAASNDIVNVRHPPTSKKKYGKKKAAKKAGKKR